MKLTSIPFALIILLACNHDNKEQANDEESRKLPIKFDSTSWTCSAEITFGHLKRRLMFMTHPVDTITGNYSGLRYETEAVTTDKKYNYPNTNLPDEMPYIKRLIIILWGLMLS